GLPQPGNPTGGGRLAGRLRGAAWAEGHPGSRGGEREGGGAGASPRHQRRARGRVGREGGGLMRQPWYQVTNELIDQVAPELAVALDWSEAAAGWGLLKAIRWVLGRCPDHEPPSANAVVRGPHAAKLIARA